jgi:hypothetical protein
MEWFVSNITTQILIHTYKLWTANKTSAITRFHLSEPSLRNTALGHKQWESIHTLNVAYLFHSCIIAFQCVPQAH